MNAFDFEATTIRGEKQSLSHYGGQVALIVNTATQCGFAPQYKGLQKLYEDYRDRGFVVLGFPCNQFRGQEPGDEAHILSVCELNHGVTFPLFAKIDVNGPDAHPLFRYLKDQARGFLGSRAIKWNFTKFLVDRSGRPVKRFSPATEPSAIEPRIRELL